MGPAKSEQRKGNDEMTLDGEGAGDAVKISERDGNRIEVEHDVGFDDACGERSEGRRESESERADGRGNVDAERADESGKIDAERVDMMQRDCRMKRDEEQANGWKKSAQSDVTDTAQRSTDGVNLTQNRVTDWST